jgi:uncharacterized protein YejL (UPF0352 family)
VPFDLLLMATNFINKTQAAIAKKETEAVASIFNHALIYDRARRKTMEKQ